MRRKKKVLVVDDNPINSAIMEEILSEHYRLCFADNGLDAIRAAMRYRPAAVLLDVMMPDMSGLDVCRLIRQSINGIPPVIIMVSAKAMPSEQAAGMDAGASDYLTKPFDEVELLTVLQRYLGTGQEDAPHITTQQTILQ